MKTPRTKKRLEVKKRLRTVYLDMEDLNSIIEHLEEIKEENKDYYNLYLIYDYDLSESPKFHLYGYREESDKEYNKRMKKVGKEKEKENEDKKKES